MVSQEIISDCIVQCKRHGSAIVVTPCNTVVLRRTTSESSKEVVLRDQLAVTQTPQAFPIKRLADAHRKALELGITNSIASCTLMVELGEEIFFSIGAETNIKLTTQDDLKIFKALLTLKDANTRL
jgi:2-C-methyl-D-erythritol 4-phosphate cytidylyltransferase